MRNYLASRLGFRVTRDNPPTLPTYFNPAHRDRYALAYLSNRLAARQRAKRRAAFAVACYLAGAFAIAVGVTLITTGDRGASGLGLGLALAGALTFLFPST